MIRDFAAKEECGGIFEPNPVADWHCIAVVGAPQLAPVPETDASLVDRICRGDEAAFGLLHARYSGRVAGVVFRMMGDETDLDDIVQETFVTAADRMETLRDPDRLSSWLCTIAVRQVHRHLRQRRRRRKLTSAYEVAAPRSSDPRAQHVLDTLYQSLDTLAPKLRIPWVLYRVEDEPLGTVAEMCGVSLATVKRRITAADAALKKRLHAT